MPVMKLIEIRNFFSREQTLRIAAIDVKMPYFEAWLGIATI
jgi:hypothetical protein